MSGINLLYYFRYLGEALALNLMYNIKLEEPNMNKMIKKITGIALVLTLAMALGGANDKASGLVTEPANQQAIQEAAAKNKAIMDNFAALLQKQAVTIPEIIAFVDGNLTAVSAADAASILSGLEQVQKERLPHFQDKFDNEQVQKILATGFQQGMPDSYLHNIQDKTVKDLLFETKNSGFRVETAEGMFFPVIDYSIYKKYRIAMPRDIADYIDIMAVESDQTPVKDAGLLISWAEILRRASAQEQFIKEFGNSTKVDDVRELLKRYTAFALYGTNNTPLFSYENKLMAAEAKQAYLTASFTAANGSFSKMMNEYLLVLKKNDYELTTEVQEYRNKAAQEFR